MEQTWKRWAASRGLDADLVLKTAHGRRTSETIRQVAPHLDADLEAHALEQAETSNMDGILEIEGAGKLLSSLPPDGWTVVTSGTRPLATRRMEHVGLSLPERFVTADDVENGKPHPEPYLRGAEALGVAPERCLVIEDAPSGIESAKSAGMRVLAVATTFDGDRLLDADAVAYSLNNVRATSRPGGGVGGRIELRVESRR